MTATSTAPPQQLRLPGQSAAPEGPVDLLMMYVMHHAFRRDLTAFCAAVRATPTHDRTTWRALAERWSIFAEALHDHHNGEDSGLWPELLAKSGPEDRRTLKEMEAEHAEIDPLLRICGAGFARLAEHNDKDARAALQVRVTAARESLGRHLKHEETGALPIVQRVLTQEDWVRIERQHFRTGDVSFRRALALVPWAAYGVPREHHARVFGSLDRAFKVIWLLTRGRFARAEQRTFKYG